MPRFYCPAHLAAGDVLDLPAAAARHVQVVRMQPGDQITLFNHGPSGVSTDVGGEFAATILQMGRTTVQVQVLQHHATEREAPRRVHLVVGMPANERMDWLVEKACELGVASIQPVMTERSVVRLQGERALKKVEHWQQVAIAACEQCGGNRVPLVHPIHTLNAWGQQLRAQEPSMQRVLLSLQTDAKPLHSLQAQGDLMFLSGPEGGLSDAEEQAARALGFAPVSLGPRVLRAETAALSALSYWVLTP